MLLILLLTAMTAISTANASPRPGDLFREYVWKGPYVNAGNWQRVTDPGASHAGAAEFLPNPVNSVTLGDLEGAVRAELYIEQWGGHAGTSAKRLRLNDSAWIDIPEPEGIPGDAGDGHPEPVCYQYFAYPSVPLPFEQLIEGENSFEFTCDRQICFNFGWGQWGVYAATFRIYYAPSSPHATGRIVSPTPGATFADSLHIVLEGDDDTAQVDFIGLYEDFDYEGNGIYRQWHYNYRYGKIARHLGTATEPPYAVTWDAAWVPDQDEPIQIMARIKDAEGVYYMTEAIGDLHLERTDRSVKLYKPFDVPGSWQTRAGNRHRCKLFVPHDLSRATAAQMILTTWSGGHADSIGINDSTVVKKVGDYHAYSYDEIDLPLHLIRSGTNEFFTYARTTHHGIEVLWPGIVLKVQYAEKLEEGSTAVLSGSAQPLPSGTRLLPNFPNPFNGRTTIRFELEEAEDIDLGIYNLAGQRLLTLTRGPYPSGLHTLQWDGRDKKNHPLSSGIYFYRLESKNRSTSRRLLLLQ